MPIFDYRCVNCGKIVERFVRNKDEKYAACVKCGEIEFKRVFSPSKAFILKGNCWEKDNYERPLKSKKEKE